MSATLRHHLFLVLKEALNNAIRHARARTVMLSIVFTSRELTISPYTVSSFVRRIYQKLHVNSRAEALAKYRGLGR